MRWILIVVVAATTATSTTNAKRTNQTASPTSHNPQLVAAGKGAVKDQLRDPDSALFRKVTLDATGGPTVKDGGHTVCGEMNAKNGYGGYGGYEPFVSIVYWDRPNGKAVSIDAIIGSDPVEIARVEKLCKN